MNEPFENLYFNWLCSKVVYLKRTTPSLTHWNLLRQLHSTEFVWLISGDDNRAEDGVFLREEFQSVSGLNDDDGIWERFPCSVLEMLVAFSKRLELATDVPHINWFWEMLRNLGLEYFTDAVVYSRSHVDEALHAAMWRSYATNGDGGFFPIENPTRDQTKVELWYQFCDYLLDQDRMP